MTAILVPTYNERENIGELLEGIAGLALPDLHVVIIDDASPDGTAGVAKRFAGRTPLTVLERPGKQGLGSAYRYGFKWALAHDAHVIFEMDGDLSHDPADIPRFLDTILQGADVVIGSRRIPGGKIVGWGLWRHFISWSATQASRIFLGTKTRDITSGFRAYRREALERIRPQDTRSNGYAFQVEMVFRAERAGLSVVEIPITFRDRRAGRSKLSSLPEGIQFLTALFRLKFHPTPTPGQRVEAEKR